MQNNDNLAALFNCLPVIHTFGVKYKTTDIVFDVYPLASNLTSIPRPTPSTYCSEQEPNTHVIIIDGSELIYMLPPRLGKTFEYNAERQQNRSLQLSC